MGDWSMLFKTKYFIVKKSEPKTERIVDSYYDLMNAMMYVEAQFEKFKLELRIVKGMSNVKGKIHERAY